jgi:hypothetical protein
MGLARCCKSTSCSAKCRLSLLSSSKRLSHAEISAAPLYRRLFVKQSMEGLYVRTHPHTDFGRASVTLYHLVAVGQPHMESLPCHPAAWDGVVFVRQGHFQGGIFKFRMLIPPTYPDTCMPVRCPTRYHIALMIVS